MSILKLTILNRDNQKNSKYHSANHYNLKLENIQIMKLWI